MSLWYVVAKKVAFLSFDTKIHFFGQMINHSFFLIFVIKHQNNFLYQYLNMHPLAQHS